MRRHELDPVSLVFGFAFTSAGLLFLAGRVEQAVRLRWLWPLLLLALGLGILVDLGARRPKAPADNAEAAETEPPVEPGGLGEDEPPAPAAPVAAEPPAEVEPVTPEKATRTDELDPKGKPPERDR
jgi:hypothetical protein